MKKIFFYAGILSVIFTISASAFFFGPIGGEGFFSGGDKGGESVSSTDVLLLETGDALLLETGDMLLLE